MKRLKKNAGVVNGGNVIINGNEYYYEVYMNPDKDDIKEIMESCPGSSGIRGLVDFDSNVFIWTSEVLHDECSYQDSGIHFIYEQDKNWMEFRVNDTTIEETMDIFAKAKGKLGKIGIDWNTSITLEVDSAPDVNEYIDNNYIFDSKTLGELYNNYEIYLSEDDEEEE